MSTPAAPLKALIAEDESAMLSLVSRCVRGLGFTVVEASEGDRAWELAQQHHPDLVVLDVMMPGMSGWEVCKRIKGPSKDGAFRQTAVIMLTGIGENLNDMTSPLFAADGWLNKPFDFKDLEARIHETLAKYGKSVTAHHQGPAAAHDGGHAPKKAAKKAAKKSAPKKTAKKTAKKSAPKKTAKKTAKKSAPKKTAKKSAPKKTARAK